VCAQAGIQKKQEEVFVVAEPNTIVNPGTMMIHPQNACAANTAMVAPVRFVLCTPFAVSAIATPLGFLVVQ
jgi:hypothetical protein